VKGVNFWRYFKTELRFGGMCWVALLDNENGFKEIKNGKR
jgi:hypothetical protein